MNNNEQHISSRFPFVPEPLRAGLNITNLYPLGRPPPLWVQAYVSAPNHKCSEVLDVNEPIPYWFGWKPLK